MQSTPTNRTAHQDNTMTENEAQDGDAVKTYLLGQFHDAWGQGDMPAADRAAFLYRRAFSRQWHLAHDRQEPTGQLALFGDPGDEQ